MSPSPLNIKWLRGRDRKLILVYTFAELQDILRKKRTELQAQGAGLMLALTNTLEKGSQL